MRILLIEDEKKTAAFLAKGLREAGVAVDLAPKDYRTITRCASPPRTAKLKYRLR